MKAYSCRPMYNAGSFNGSNHQLAAVLDIFQRVKPELFFYGSANDSLSTSAPEESISRVLQELAHQPCIGPAFEMKGHDEPDKPHHFARSQGGSVQIEDCQ